MSYIKGPVFDNDRQHVVEFTDATEGPNPNVYYQAAIKAECTCGWWSFYDGMTVGGMFRSLHNMVLSQASGHIRESVGETVPINAPDYIDW